MSDTQPSAGDTPALGPSSAPSLSSHRFAPSINALLSARPPRLGPFRIVAPLGEGGFAPVFLAVEEYNGVELRSVALKLFALDDFARHGGLTPQASELAHKRIVEEARALCRVEHPNIVRFVQLIEEGFILGLAMEHVRGVPLHTTLEAEGALGVETTLNVGIAVASALAAIHGAGLVHRDVKPDNLIQTSGQYKLIDFGIAARFDKTTGRRRRAAPHPEIAKHGTFVVGKTSRATGDAGANREAPDVAGTMGYIDPACLGQGAPADATSDLYALGATLYECLSGRLPASTGPGQEVTRLRMPVALGTSPPPPLREIAPYVPEDVAMLIDSLVAPNREHRPTRAEWVAAELERLKRLVKLGLPRSLPERGPFRGLEAFTEKDRDILMGRAAELASAVDVLRLRGVLALIGASGSGKTSFARAAVAPAVAEGALGAWPTRWVTVKFSPGRDARASLARALLETTPVGTGIEQRTDFRLEDHGNADAPIATLLGKRVETDATGILLVIDSLEELVTISDPKTRMPLLRLLADLSASPRPGLRAIVTLRRDLLDPLLALANLAPALTRGAQMVAPLSASSLGAALEERLAAYGYALEDAAMRTALSAELAATAESMPLVEFALSRLWEARDPQKRILSRASLTKVGGLAGALNQHAESVTSALVASRGPTVVEAIRRVLLELTTPQGTRRLATLEEIERLQQPFHAEIIDAFINARLIVKEDGRLTLAHEALLLQWPRLTRWTQEARRDRERVVDVERDAKKWVAAKAGEKTDLLLRGVELKTAQRISSDMFSPDANAFLRASNRFALRGKAAFATLILALVGLLATFSYLYVLTRREAEHQKQMARAVVTQLTEARNTPEAERAKEVVLLIKQKHSCERALAKCEGSASATPTSSPTPPATPSVK